MRKTVGGLLMGARGMDNADIGIVVCVQIIDDIADTGAASLDIDTPVDFGKARDRVGKRLTMVGNIDPVAIYKSTPDHVTELCKNILKDKHSK